MENPPRIRIIYPIMSTKKKLRPFSVRYTLYYFSGEVPGFVSEKMRTEFDATPHTSGQMEVWAESPENARFVAGKFLGSEFLSKIGDHIILDITSVEEESDGNITIRTEDK